MADVTLDMDKLAAAIAHGIAAGQAGSNEKIAEIVATVSRPKKVEFGEYLDKRNAGRPALARDTFWCGFPVDEEALTQDGSYEGIELANKIDRSGFYLDKMVRVDVREMGGGRQSVYINYPNASPDQRNIILRKVPDAVSLLRVIVAAQEVEREEEAHEKEFRKQMRAGGTFGNNKAYRDAKAAADARAQNG